MGSAISTAARQPVRAASAAFAGTTIEWYDFFIYSTASALAFPQLFFPNSDPNVSLLISLATFGVGFFARPLGGFFFGHLGDRLGRKKALIATLLLMGLSTASIGVLPTYAQIGIWAPVLLVVLRIGVAIGREPGVLIHEQHLGPHLIEAGLVDSDTGIHQRGDGSQLFCRGCARLRRAHVRSRGGFAGRASPDGPDDGTGGIRRVRRGGVKANA